MNFKLSQVVNQINQHKNEQVDGMILYSTYNRFWFLEFASSDGYVFVNAKGDAIYLVDARYFTSASQQVTNAKVVLLQSTKEKTYLDLMKECLDELNIKNPLIESDYVTLEAYETFKKITNKTTLFKSANLRAVKTDKELALLQKAADIAAATCIWIKEQQLIGKSEIEVSNMLTKHMLDLGASKNSFDPIVASGPNGGNPHHHPSSRIIENGDMLTIDLGCLYQGYCSDMTRSFIVGDKPNPIMQEVYDKVLEAQVAGIKKVSTSVSGYDVDLECRKIIDDSKFKGYFTHGTGHGLGIEVHEQPNTNAGNKQKLPLNAVVTVEPGIYIPNVGGVRIEDSVVVKDGEAIVLTKAAPK